MTKREANMRRLIFLATWLLAGALAVSGLSRPARAATGTRWALLVGVEQYENADITKLDFAVNDVRAVSRALTASVGFPADHVLTMTSDLQRANLDYPTAVNVLKRLRILAGRIGPEDTFLFYFSGHGFSRGKEGQFLGTIEADATDLATLKKTTLELADIREQMEKIVARQVIFVIDACRNDPEKSRGLADNPLQQDFSRTLRLVADAAARGQTGSAVLFACSDGERAFEDPQKQQGVFSYYLLEALQGKAGSAAADLTINDVAEYVQKHVTRWAEERNRKQTPVLHTAGAAKIVIASAGRRTVTDVRVEDVATKPLPTPPAGTLAVLEVADTGFPDTVFLNGERKGSTPVVIRDLKPGVYTVRIEASSFRSFENRVQLDAEKKTVIEPELIPQDDLGAALKLCESFGKLGYDKVPKQPLGPNIYSATLPTPWAEGKAYVISGPMAPTALWLVSPILPTTADALQSLVQIDNALMLCLPKSGKLDKDQLKQGFPFRPGLAVLDAREYRDTRNRPRAALLLLGIGDQAQLALMFVPPDSAH
jgi:uncharacterized caspase-like protein